MTQQVLDADRLQPQAYADLDEEQLKGLQRVALQRAHDAKATYESELIKLGAINTELKNRRRIS